MIRKIGGKSGMVNWRSFPKSARTTRDHPEIEAEDSAEARNLVHNPHERI
jgi:hypothetical protein